MNNLKKINGPDIQTRIRIKAIRDLMGDVSNKTILDLGASIRAITKGMNAQKVITLDALDDSGMGIKCDLNEERIPLPDDSIDLIIAGELIEHIPNTKFFLESCKKILKKREGVLVFSTPNICCFKDRIRMLLGEVPFNCAKCSKEGTDKYKTHVRDFNLKELKKILNIAGFEIEKIKTNGIISHSRLFFPIVLTPVTFGEGFIIRCKLLNK